MTGANRVTSKKYPNRTKPGTSRLPGFRQRCSLTFKQTTDCGSPFDRKVGSFPVRWFRSMYISQSPSDHLQRFGRMLCGLVDLFPDPVDVGELPVDLLNWTR
jgi:hypothetical protein